MMDDHAGTCDDTIDKQTRARVTHNAASSDVMGRLAWATCRGAVLRPTKVDRPEKGVAVSI